MSRMGAFLALSLASSLTLAGASRAQSLGDIAEVSIIDRDTGVVLSPHYYRGDYWVAGPPGAKYAIEVRNRLGERLLAVTSVDGVNVLSGATAAFDQAGYVFAPGEQYGSPAGARATLRSRRSRSPSRPIRTPSAPDARPT